MPAYGVLVFPGGTEIGLELRRSLADLKEIRLAGAGSEQDRHGAVRVPALAHCA